MKESDHKLHIVLEDVRSAFNVGAVFRTCDAAGVYKLWLTGITPYPPHNRIPKTALGASESVNWEYQKSINTVIDKLKKENIEIVAAELTNTSEPYTDVDYPKNTAIIFGNEIAGVTPETLKQCRYSVQIPMYGKKKSLNVEVSCGIIIYEVVRQWRIRK